MFFVNDPGLYVGVPYVVVGTKKYQRPLGPGWRPAQGCIAAGKQLPRHRVVIVYGCVCVCTLCLSQLKFLQSVFTQVIPGQVFPGHQSNHLVLIIHYHQVSETQRSEQLKHTRQRGFLWYSVRRCVHEFSEVHHTLPLVL